MNIYDSEIILTTDKAIRSAFLESLELQFKQNSDVRIIEELGITHGAARVDIALVNGIIHGFELKSDRDTLERLPEQVRIFNLVLDRVTIVVGKNHLFEAIHLVPDWWGVILAKSTTALDAVEFYNLRDAEDNPIQVSAAIASLLWRDEALHILEQRGFADGFRSKSRHAIYERLAEVLDTPTLKSEVRNYLSSRLNWRFEIPCMPNGG